MDAETRIFYIFKDYKDRKIGIENIRGWLKTLHVHIPADKIEEFENSLEYITQNVPQDKQYDIAAGKIAEIEGLIKSNKYSHNCPFCGQGQIRKLLYGENAFDVYECDECYLFWKHPYYQSLDDASGQDIEKYLNENGIFDLENYIDAGNYY